MTIDNAARTVCRSAAIALSATLAGAVNAALLAYDPFAYGADPSAGEYVLGDEISGSGVIGGQSPVIGPTPFYTGPWIQSGGDSQAVKALPSLSYPALQAGVGGIQRETVQSDCCSFGRSGREINGGLGGGRDPRTIYQSFVVDFGSQGTDPPTDFGFRGHELWGGGVGDSFAAVQLFINHFAGINTLSLTVNTVSSQSTVPVAGNLDLATLAGPNNGMHLVVMKYEFRPDTPDVVSVYFDPATGIEPALPDAQISVAASDLFITHQGAFTNFTFSGAGHVPGAIDEIRWGDTYADVTPVPEPTTLTLIVMGLLALQRGATRRQARATWGEEFQRAAAEDRVAVRGRGEG